MHLQRSGEGDSVPTAARRSWRKDCFRSATAVAGVGQSILMMLQEPVPSPWTVSVPAQVLLELLWGSPLARMLFCL
jgi:hypothetical protein